MTSPASKNRNKSGAALLVAAMFIFVMMIGSGALLTLTVQNRRTAQAQNDKILANNLAEAGAYRALAELNEAAKDMGLAIYDMSSSAFSSYAAGKFAETVNGSGGSREVDLRHPSDGSYELVSLTRSPDGSRYTIRARGTYTNPGNGRTYQTDVELDAIFLFDTDTYGKAIVSDKTPTWVTISPSGAKAFAQEGNVVFTSGGNVIIVGGVAANGRAYHDVTALNDANVHGHVTAEQDAELKTLLASTPAEIPDYTAPGSADQLFDFGRFIAGSDAMHTSGDPKHFSSLEDFVDEVNAKNGASMDGIIVVDIDPAEFAQVVGDDDDDDDDPTVILHEPRLDADPGTDGNGAFYDVADIHVEGTLLFNFEDRIVVGGTDYGPTPEDYSLVLDTGLNINPAGSSDITLYESEMAAYKANRQLWEDGGSVGDPPPLPNPPSGYPAFGSGSYAGANPWDYALSGFENFAAEDDFPALMINNGWVDIENNLNISGAVYTPNHLEIENLPSGAFQFISGQVITGGGVYMGADNGPVILVYDKNAVDALATKGSAYKSLRVIGWRTVTP